MECKQCTTINIDVYLSYHCQFTLSRISHQFLTWLILENPHSYSIDAFIQFFMKQPITSWQVYFSTYLQVWSSLQPCAIAPWNVTVMKTRLLDIGTLPKKLFTSKEEKSFGLTHNFKLPPPLYKTTNWG